MAFLSIYPATGGWFATLHGETAASLRYARCWRRCLPDQYLDQRGAARLLGVSASDVGRICQQRLLRGKITTAGGPLSFKRRDVEALARKRRASKCEGVEASEGAESGLPSAVTKGSRAIITIPNRPESAGAKAFDRVLSRAAGRAGYPVGVVKLVMLHMFQEIVDELMLGQAVLIRGFGMFATRPYRMPGMMHSTSVPIFVPSRGLRQEVQCAILPALTSQEEARRFQKRQRIRSVAGRFPQRVSRFMERERKRLKNSVTDTTEVN